MEDGSPVGEKQKKTCKDVNHWIKMINYYFEYIFRSNYVTGTIHVNYHRIIS